LPVRVKFRIVMPLLLRMRKIELAKAELPPDRSLAPRPSNTKLWRLEMVQPASCL